MTIFISMLHTWQNRKCFDSQNYKYALLFYHKYAEHALMRIFLSIKTATKKNQNSKTHITHWLVKAAQTLRTLVRVIQYKEI